MGKKIVTFGELLLRFSKPGQLRLTQGDLFTSKYGGSEANVAVSLATQGEDVTYITRLPETPVGRAGAMNLIISSPLQACVPPRLSTTAQALPTTTCSQV